MNYTLPHFGELPLENLKDYYIEEIDFNGMDLSIDINFESPIADVETMDKIKSFLENIEQFDKLNKTYIRNDYNDDDADTVKFYIDNHLEDLGREHLSSLVNFDDTTIAPELQLLDQLHLIRVGLYPGEDDYFATFDYSIGEEITNYLVVINTDENGGLVYMTMES